MTRTPRVTREDVDVLSCVLWSEKSSGTDQLLLAIGWSIRNRMLRYGFVSVAVYLAGSYEAARDGTGYGRGKATKQGSVIPNSFDRRGRPRRRAYAASRLPKTAAAWARFRGLSRKILTDPLSKSPIGPASLAFEPKLQDDLWCAGRAIASGRNAQMIEDKWTRDGRTVPYANVESWRFYARRSQLPNNGRGFRPPPLPRSDDFLRYQAALSRAQESPLEAGQAPVSVSSEEDDFLSRVSLGNVSEQEAEELRSICNPAATQGGKSRDRGRVQRTAPEPMDVGAPLELRFRELPDQTMHCNVAIFVAGVEVSAYLQGDITAKYGLGTDFNTLSFTLQNAGVAAPRGSRSERENPFVLSHRNLINPDGRRWRLSQSDLASYSEYIKYQIYRRKHQSPQNRPDPVVGAVNLTSVEGSGVGDSAGARPWPLDLDRVVFHKHDAVVAWIAMPTVEPTSRADTRWLPLFCGFLDSYPLSEDALTGTSTIQMSAYDIRALMKNMRVLVNPTALQSNEQVEYERNSFLTDGLFRDISLIPSTGDGGPLANKSMEQILAYLFAGTVIERYEGDQGFFAPVSRPPEAVGDLIYPGSSPSGLGVGVGDMALGTLNGHKGVFPLPPRNKNRSQFLAQWHALSLCGSYLVEKEGNPKRGWYTTKEIEEISSQSSLELTGKSARFNPTARKVYIMTPEDGTPISGLYQSSANYANSASAEWARRLNMVDDTLQKLGGYEWYVSPFGDVFVEPPLMDFTPHDFSYGRRSRRGYREHLTVDKHLTQVTVTEEQGEIPTGLKITGPVSQNVEINASTNEHVVRAFTECTYIVKNLALRHGLVMQQVSFPWLTGTALQGQADGPVSEDQLRFQRLMWGLLELQKRLATASAINLSMIWRPFLMLNRPLWVKPRNRMARISGLTHTMSINGECRTDVTTDYVLSMYFPERSDGKILSETPLLRHITGHGSMPMSFRNSEIDPKKAGILTSCIEDQRLREGFTDQFSSQVQSALQQGFALAGGLGSISVLTREDLPSALGATVSGNQALTALGASSAAEQDIVVDAETGVATVPIPAADPINSMVGGRAFVQAAGRNASGESVYTVTVQTSGRDIIYNNVTSPSVSDGARVSEGEEIGRAGTGGVALRMLDQGRDINPIAGAEMLLNDRAVVVDQPQPVPTSGRPSVPLITL